MSPYPPVNPALICCPHPLSQHGPNGCLEGWGDATRPAGGCACRVRGPEAVTAVAEQQLATRTYTERAVIESLECRGRLAPNADPWFVRHADGRIEQHWPEEVDRALVSRPLIEELVTAAGERDRATDAAVALEQECARLAAEGTRLRRIRGSLQQEIRQLRDALRVEGTP